MGYGQGAQTTHGIHQRLWARAFVVSQGSQIRTADEERAQSIEKITHEDASLAQEDTAQSWFRFLDFWSWSRESDETYGPATGQGIFDPDSSICFVSIDTCMTSDALPTRVLDRLDELLSSESDGTIPNLCQLGSLTISATHTHSGPAGFLQYALYQIQSMGFIPKVVDILVEGIAQALFKAHRHLKPGSILVSEGYLYGASINRSPTSYLKNPEKERDEYIKEGDTDKRMLQLVFECSTTNNPAETVAVDRQLVGVLNWFAVHPTSMNSTNQLISGDNKGYASYLMERKHNPLGMRMGDEDKHTFVAAFASTNLGDVSPNTAGPRCLDSGLSCEPGTSTCNGRNELCVAFGPGRDMFESTEIIGQKQFQKANELLDSALADRDRSRMASGLVRFRHAFVDMSHLNVTLESGDTVHTCPAAIGFGFAAGTIDGHGAFDFMQGSNSSNPFWNMVSAFLSAPSQAQIACQAPKPILLNTGYIHTPYDWDPNIVPISVFQINKLFILNVPGEFTTMAGRRLRKAVHTLVEVAGYEDARVTIAGLSNTYTHYITTREEYQGQRYEAASTLYGQYTLEAYIQEFTRLVNDLLEDRPTQSGPAPKDRVNQQISLLPDVEFDVIGAGRSYGSVAEDANDSYESNGGETVKVLFRSSNPRNNPKIQDTYLTVERLGDHGLWSVWLTDADWDTKFIWRGGWQYFGTSFAEIHWKIASDTPQGIYRICHFGTRRTLFGHTGEFFHKVPDSLGGSAGINLILAVSRLVFDLSDRIRRLFGHKHIHHFRDFHGCSSSFVVYDG
ncbi:hypothetical protein ACA910_000568 [Epithemia clementina (nom. ined.)]